MNTTTKWIFFGLLGALVLGVSVWSFAGPGALRTQTPGAMMAQPWAERAGMMGAMMGSGHPGFEHAGQRWEQMGQRMQAWMQSMMGAVGPTPNVEAPSSPSDASVEGALRVDIANFSFTPARLTVKLGEAVRWTNQDSVQHNVVFDDGKLSSPLLAQGQSWTHTFAQEGTYSYTCGPHPFMKGTIVVER